MKRSRPSQCVGYGFGARAQDLRRNALNTPSQFGRCAAGEGEKKNATRICAVDDQMGDSMGESFGLAGASTSDHEKGPSVIVGNAHVVLYGLALLPIELAEIRGGVWHVESVPGLCFQHGSRFVHVKSMARNREANHPLQLGQRRICRQSGHDTSPFELAVVNRSECGEAPEASMRVRMASQLLKQTD